MASISPTIDPHLMDPLFHLLEYKVVPMLVGVILLAAILRVLLDYTGNKFVCGIRRWRDARRSQKSAPTATNNIPPQCPVCNRLMVKRQVKKGANAGRSFWGCSAFPDCRGTRKL